MFKPNYNVQVSFNHVAYLLQMIFIRRLAGPGGGGGGGGARWENCVLSNKLAHQLAQPLLAAGGVAPPWVEAMPKQIYYNLNLLYIYIYMYIYIYIYTRTHTTYIYIYINIT